MAQTFQSSLSSFHLDKEEEGEEEGSLPQKEEEDVGDGEKSLVITNSSFSRTFQLLFSSRPKWNRRGNGKEEREDISLPTELHLEEKEKKLFLFVKDGFLFVSLFPGFISLSISL